MNGEIICMPWMIGRVNCALDPLLLIGREPLRVLYNVSPTTPSYGMMYMSFEMVLPHWCHLRNVPGADSQSAARHCRLTREPPQIVSVAV